MKYHLLTACAAALLTATPAAAKTVNIGVSMSRSEHLFLVKMRDAMQEQANGLKDVSLQFEDAQGDVGRQVNQVQNFIAQGVDAIIVNAADTSATEGITKMVTGAGIPLVYVNLGPGKDEKLPPKVAVVASDHIVSGRLEMDGLAKCMHDKGDVAIMLGELASNATDERTAGNKEVIAKHPDIKVVQEQTANYQRNQAIDLMNNWITNGEQVRRGRRQQRRDGDRRHLRHAAGRHRPRDQVRRRHRRHGRRARPDEEGQPRRHGVPGRQGPGQGRHRRGGQARQGREGRDLRHDPLRAVTPRELQAVLNR